MTHPLCITLGVFLLVLALVFAIASAPEWPHDRRDVRMLAWSVVFGVAGSALFATGVMP